MLEAPGQESKDFNPAAPHFRGGVATAGTQSKSLNRKIYFCKRSNDFDYSDYE